MKKSHLLPRRHRGFSLVELLVVISIIVILAGIGLAAFAKVKKNQAVALTKVRIKYATLKIHEYASENNGLYPVGDEAGSSIIYNALSGDYTGQGQKPTGPTYWKELLTKDPSLVGQFQGNNIILDGFGQQLRYRSATDDDGKPVPEAKNTPFDIWSIGPDGKPSDINVDSNAVNEDTVDDIWD